VRERTRQVSKALTIEEWVTALGSSLLWGETPDPRDRLALLTLASSAATRGVPFERGEQARAVAGKSLPPQRFAVQVVLPAHEATASSYIPVLGLYTSQFFR
jgi:hypothetical protein